MRRWGLALLALTALSGCGSDAPADDSSASGSGASGDREAKPRLQRYRSDAGIVFRIPASWTVQNVGANAAIVPPGITLDPGRSDNAQVYLVLGAEDQTDLDAPELATALEAMLAAENLQPQGQPQKETLDAGGRQARRYRWQGPAIASGTLALHAYLVREGRFLLILMAAADNAAMTKHERVLRDVTASLDYDPGGTKFPDARSTSAPPPPQDDPSRGGQPPAPGPGGGAIASSISGVWVGKLTGKTETIDDAQFTFTPAGNLLYEYRVRGGDVRTVEWTGVGQKVQYIPPNGGVQTITIQAFDRAPGRLSMTQRWVFEKSGNMLDQTFQTSQLEFALTTAGLRVTMATATENYINGNAVGTEQETYTGTLRPR